MRNKILLAMSVAGMMCSATAFAEGSTATASGKITAIGTITNAPCDIKPGDEDLIVNFNQVSNKKLKAPNTADATNVRHVSIHLANCSFEASSDTPPKDLLSKVTMTFTGNQSGDDGKYFANSTASGMAKNVGLLLRKTNGDDITPSTGIADLQLKAGDNNTINFDALLVNTGAENSVTTGEINIPVTYTLTYQ